jgi:RNA polymerase-associated protein LEO1
MSSPTSISPHNLGHEISGHAESAPPSSPEDVEMGGITNDTFDSKTEEKDDGMGDLFGNEEDVKDAGRVIGELFFEIKHIDSNISLASPSRSATPTSERLLTPEAEHRRAMEYSEGDEPSNIIHTVQEADVPIPNIPLPHSSDGAVSPLVYR